MSSTPPVIFPVPSAWKLPAMATAPLASNPFIKYANEPDISDSRPVAHAAAPGALMVNVKLADLLASSAAVAMISGVLWPAPVGTVSGGVYVALVEGPVPAGGIAVKVPQGLVDVSVLQLAGLNVQMTPLVGEMSFVTVAFTVTAGAAASMAVNGLVIATVMVEVIVTLKVELVLLMVGS